ncbi:MAG: alpha/beta hydrolase [Pseudomonadota bacterium]|nr:alpha/beta hydrolase [Pseudomonadota bacterium]
MNAMKWIIGTCSLFAPAVTGRWAAQRFFTPGARARQSRTDTMAAPDKAYGVGGAFLRVWQGGDRMAMLIAGWEGHYTQFSALVPALHRAGWTVVTVDPPGHGSAGGRHSNPALFARALHVAAAELGTPDVLMGHSMGGIAAMLAVHQGLNARQLVTVATPDAVAGPIDRFAAFIGLRHRAQLTLRQTIEEVTRLPIASVDVRLLAKAEGRELLAIHDVDDRIVPATSAERIMRQWRGARAYMTQGLGHARLLRDEGVVQAVVEFADAGGG